MTVHDAPQINEGLALRHIEKIVRLDEFDAYLSAEVAAVDYASAGEAPLVFYRIKVALNQRVDATFSSGFELFGGHASGAVAADLYRMADLFGALAEALVANEAGAA